MVRRCSSGCLVTSSRRVAPRNCLSSLVPSGAASLSLDSVSLPGSPSLESHAFASTAAGASGAVVAGPAADSVLETRGPAPCDHHGRLGQRPLHHWHLLGRRRGCGLPGPPAFVPRSVRILRQHLTHAIQKNVSEERKPAAAKERPEAARSRSSQAAVGATPPLRK